MKLKTLSYSLCICLAVITANCLFAQRQLPEINSKRLDSVFGEANVSITYSKAQNTCFVLYRSKEVVLSVDLLNKLLNAYNVPSDFFFVEGMLSHEYGHIKQFEKGMNMTSDDLFMQRELHCDLIAGYYLSNYFRNEFLKGDISDANIIGKVCDFFSSRNRNPNLYLIVSMLINSSYDYSYDAVLFKGNTPETVKLLRFTSFWQGIRLSENSSIDKVYEDGLAYVKRLINDKTQDKTYKTFDIIGIDVINNILHGTYNCKKTVSVIGNRIAVSGNISMQEKLQDALVLATVASCCPN